MTHYPELMPWVPPLHEIWTKNHPNYPADKELDYPALRVWGIWIAKRNGIDLKEPVPQHIQKELQKSFDSISKLVANHNKYRLFSLDKLERFYKQEIMIQLAEQTNTKPKMIL